MACLKQLKRKRIECPGAGDARFKGVYVDFELFQVDRNYLVRYFCDNLKSGKCYRLVYANDVKFFNPVKQGDCLYATEEHDELKRKIFGRVVIGNLKPVV